ncbi:PREDICTED: uncharacterized protein LOC109580369 isoform X2 [Amphimedon queenslandica]|uniref:Death domain-containing protein n=1 Tax=Amphimedon queenslandica TaxID=400682 RepID=A0AAN0IVZ5_AMPQE|nr:PREDICTED: uncharacterized protein LOC109580369 isoform X2 [Amphimedon queenslandica]|eukprot:XP_019848985.1 PREDICTED: uncharacterized protein LOC109580369 isoform X2 [Amphimedon queenslandica]
MEKQKATIKESSAAASIKQDESSTGEHVNLEYTIFKKNLPQLNDILTGNPELIIKLAIRLFAEKSITKTTYQKAADVNLGAVVRAYNLLNSVLTALQTNPNRNEIFKKLCISLDELEIDTTMLKHQENTVTKTEGNSTVESLEQQVAAFSIDKNQDDAGQGNESEADMVDGGAPLPAVPRESELMNDVAAKAPDQWKNIGTMLDIQFSQLNSFSMQYHADPMDCYRAVFQHWARNQ